MYKLLLIAKYLCRQAAPLFAALAVMMCTAMVLIVISVMGGFLDKLTQSIRELAPDVTAKGPVTGFAEYEQLTARLEALPEVEAATPVIETLGLVRIGERSPSPVRVEGIRPADYDRVLPFRSRAYWTADDLIARWEVEDPGRIADIRRRYDLVEAAMQMREPAQDPDAGDDGDDGDTLPGMVVGIGLTGKPEGEGGRLDPAYGLFGLKTTLSVVPMTRQGGFLGQADRRFVIANEYKSGHVDFDKGRVFVGFGELQDLLTMNAKARLDPRTGRPTGDTVPARATQVIAKAADGYELEAVRAAVKQEVDRFLADNRGKADVPVVLSVYTSTDEFSTLLNAVRNEKQLITFLFVIISGVAVVMVAITFYMTVLSKTRDIGVLRAVGASGAGVLTLFLGYGLAVGVIGAALGLGGAFLVVHFINEIQFFLANYLGATAVIVGGGAVAGIVGLFVGAALGARRHAVLRWMAVVAVGAAAGAAVVAAAVLLTQQPWTQWLNANIRWVMWNPEIYAFDEIPARLDPLEATVITIGAVVSSVIGVTIPALIASQLRPVDALRHE